MKAKSKILAGLFAIALLAGCQTPMHTNRGWDYTIRDYGLSDTGLISRFLAKLSGDGWMVDRVYSPKPGQDIVFILRRAQSPAHHRSAWEYSLSDYRGFNSPQMFSGVSDSLDKSGKEGWTVVAVVSGGEDQGPLIILRRHQK